MITLLLPVLCSRGLVQRLLETGEYPKALFRDSLTEAAFNFYFSIFYRFPEICLQSLAAQAWLSYLALKYRIEKS
jgi:hypothetical protein